MNNFYDQLMEDLLFRITSTHGSVKAFSEKFGYNRHNFSKIFNGHQRISLQLYIRVCVSLGVLSPEHNTLINTASDFTLYEYLVVSPSFVHASILEIITNPTGEK